MKEIYDAAVIGCGRMGGTIDDEMWRYPKFKLPYSHGTGYAACPRTRIVAAADPVEEKRMQFGERYGLPRDHLFADAREMLARVPVDIASVTSRAPQHCENVLEAVEGGVKAIFCEKPLAASLEEGGRMVAAAEKRNLVTAVCTQRRWDVLWNKVKEILDSGQAGTVSHIVQHSGSALLHEESHFFDLSRYLMGDPKPEWAVGHLVNEKPINDDGTVGDSGGHGYVRYKNGAEHYLVGQGGMRLETTVVCTEAVFRCFNNGDSMRMWVKDPESAAGYVKEVPFDLPEPASSTLRAIDEIVECLDRGGNTRCTLRDGLIGMEMGMAIHESHRLGNVRVNWPIEHRSLKVLAH